MAAKKKIKKTKENVFTKEMNPDAQSVAVGSVVSVILALALKSLIFAIPAGLLFAFAHKHGLGKSKKK
jgi:ABC-type phosphate transport system permease subunit